MTDWSKSMTQTFEYYTVNPNTWKDVDLLTNVKSATISRDSTAETLGSASFDIDDDIGECYIRAYLKVVQMGLQNVYLLEHSFYKRKVLRSMVSERQGQ